ncbi:unnamed protein product [Mytilus edulis]|uniref:G-protein coupled receptors family 1 profile domain-containing protein n=1 Tax=Mytilus edulis TaxID=6550 RepID=A0A8S3TXJ8_MYTED|nr:unnamed protein product [Mytilus edulis]
MTNLSTPFSFDIDFNASTPSNLCTTLSYASTETSTIPSNVFTIPSNASSSTSKADKMNMSNGTTLEQIIVVDFRQWYQHGFEIVIYAYGIPILTVFNIVMYSFMIFVFFKNGMNSKSHLCLIAIAICDSIGPLFPSIMWVYFFAIRNHLYYLPYEWCRVYHYMTEVLPKIFTTASFYTTVLLAAQRYICVGHPFKADRLCSKKIITYCICGLFGLSLLMKGIFFVHYDYFGITVPAFVEENATMEACAVRAPEWIKMTFFEYLAIVQILEMFIFNVIPSTVLLIFEILLVIALKKSTAARKKMSTNAKMRKENQLTYSTIAITSLSLLQGLFTIFSMSFDFLYLMFDVETINNNDIRSISTASSISYIVLTPSNFIITCCLSSEFRNNVKAIFTSSSAKVNRPKDTSKAVSISTASTSGSTVSMSDKSNISYSLPK